MQLVARLPQFGEWMRSGVVRKLLVEVGAEVGVGTPLFEVLVDLSYGAAQDCPPVFHLRVTSRERGWVRELLAAPDQELAVDAPVLMVTTTPDEPVAAAARTLRVTAVTVHIDTLFDP